MPRPEDVPATRELIETLRSSQRALWCLEQHPGHPVVRWLLDPPTHAPGTVMPNLKLTEDQARDVAHSLAAVQKRAAEWGGDPSRVLLMGHSAGAHLAALVGASTSLWREADALKPRGVVSLDSGALDVPDLLERPLIPPLYHRAFGSNASDWIAASPHHQLTRDAVPMLLVCSTRRPDACLQGRAMVEKARSLGVAMDVLPEDLSHVEVNRELGLPSTYTEAVDAFVRRQLQ